MKTLIEDSEAQISELVEALRTVKDPCSLAMGAPIDVWSMGLIDEVSTEGNHIQVKMVLTDFSCSYFGQMKQHITDAVRTVMPEAEVSIELDGAVMWTPDRQRVPVSDQIGSDQGSSDHGDGARTRRNFDAGHARAIGD